MGVLDLDNSIQQDKHLSWEMVMAVKDDNQPEVESLVKAGEDLSYSDETGNSVIHWAMAEDSRCGDKLLEYLLSCGAPPDSENWYGKKPRDFAVRYDKIKLAMVLMKHKVSFD